MTAVIALERGGNANNIESNRSAGQVQTAASRPSEDSQAQSSGGGSASLTQRHVDPLTIPTIVRPFRLAFVPGTQAPVSEPRYNSGGSTGGAQTPAQSQPPEPPTRTPTPAPTATLDPTPTEVIVYASPIPAATTVSSSTGVRPHLRSIRACESGGDYQALNSAGPFYGAYQFLQSTWNDVITAAGFPEYYGVDPRLAPPQVQDQAAEYLYVTGGAGHWPVCQYQ